MKRLLSLLLAVVMVFVAVPYITVSSNAATTSVNTWPGQPMNVYNSTSNIFYFDVPLEYNYFIFSDGNYYNGQNNGIAWQTKDIAFVSNNKLYYPNLSDTSYVYGATNCSVSVIDYNQGENSRRVYFKAPLNWETPSCFCWASKDYVFVPNTNPDISIPSDAYEYNGSYYKVYNGVCNTWEEAKAYCEGLGGHLATIVSDEENSAVYSYVTSSGYKNAYFGYHDSTTEGKWEWVNGETSSYTNWHSGEPNSADTLEDYAMFYYKYSDGKWNDGNFGQGTDNDDKTFICEWDHNIDTDTETYLGFGSANSYIYNCTAIIGEEANITVVLKSDEYKIEDLKLEVEDTSVAEIKSISIGEGDYIASGNEKVATIYLDAKKIDNTSLTATAPDGNTATCKIVVEEKQQSEEEKEITNLINDVEMGPFAMTGATIDVAGYEIPLLELEATIKMELGNLQIVNDLESNTIQVLLGFDQNASANIDGAQNSTTYWSESYKEVKSMYQSLTGKKVDTTRLWNKYSSLRGKLKKCNANMVIDVSSDLTGYIELKRVGDSYTFSEGGVMASFSADTSIRSYYGPAYVALGLGVNANGNLVFVYENNEINTRINVNPSFIVSVGAGIGTRKTYAEIDAYGTLGAEISSYAENPFIAYLDLGVEWSGYIIGKELFSGTKSFSKTQLYPDFGQNMRMKAIASTGADLSDVNYYNDLLNSSQTISRKYLNRKFSSKLDVAQTSASNGNDTISFEKANSYPLSEPSLVSFNDGTALLVWIDDSGKKSNNNMCSLYYSFFDGENWTTLTELFENGTANDMPYVYSDGIYAYIVWQKADQIFDDEISVTDMIQHFDLYETTFNSADQSFTEPMLINSDSNNIFEFNPQICGNDGSFTVSWIENSDNNILQMSGKNVLKRSVYNNLEKTTLCENIIETEEIISKTILNNYGVYYSLQTDNGSTLYQYYDNITTRHGEIQDFAVASGTLFYLKDGAVYSRIGEQDYKYSHLSGLNNFTITDDGESMYLFTLVLNEDFTKSLYYSTYNYDNGSWSMLECYREGNHYIRNYSPAIINDEILVAYNLVTKDTETDYQQSSLIVDAKIDAIDIQLNYVDFSLENIYNSDISLTCELQNNSSKKIDEIEYYIFDENTEIIDSGVQTCEIPAFSTTTKTLIIDGLEEYMGALISVEILATKNADYNEANNSVTTSLELIPKYNDSFILGDVDGDGDVTILDATMVQRHIAELPNDVFVEVCADTDKDGVISIMDATMIQRYIAQLIPSL